MVLCSIFIELCVNQKQFEGLDGSRIGSFFSYYIEGIGSDWKFTGITRNSAGVL